MAPLKASSSTSHNVGCVCTWPNKHHGTKWYMSATMTFRSKTCILTGCASASGGEQQTKLHSVCRSRCCCRLRSSRSHRVQPDKIIMMKKCRRTRYEHDLDTHGSTFVHSKTWLSLTIMDNSRTVVPAATALEHSWIRSAACNPMMCTPMISSVSLLNNT